jgi:hypothetical protein
MSSPARGRSSLLIAHTIKRCGQFNVLGDSQVARLGSLSSAIELRPPGPEGWTPAPKGSVPFGRSEQTCLATGHHAEVSILSGRGDRCIPYPDHYSPAFASSAILYPQQLRVILQPHLSHLSM